MAELSQYLRADLLGIGKTERVANYTTKRESSPTLNQELSYTPQAGNRLLAHFNDFSNTQTGEGTATVTIGGRLVFNNTNQSLFNLTNEFALFGSTDETITYKATSANDTKGVFIIFLELEPIT